MPSKELVNNNAADCASAPAQTVDLLGHIMAAGKKKTLKNRLRAASKLSQYKTEQILRCFADGLPTQEASLRTRVSVATVRKRYAEFREALFHGAIAYRQLFSGAGILMAFGPPPHADEMISSLHARRQGRSRVGDGFIWEIVIRDYARFRYSEAEHTVLCVLALAFIARFRKVLVTEYRKLPPLLDCLPQNPAQEMTLAAFRGSAFMDVPMKEYIVSLWATVERGDYRVPQTIWPVLFGGRRSSNPADRIYRDLRWYLHKHPRGKERKAPSRYWDDFPSPPLHEIQTAAAAFFARIRPVNS